ncbi:cohesin domain-containing protein [Sellimonas catena]|uniref:Cohesin domain-containing protein n=1 Tax=Sellimonas catena TaxID=2994035 RepID=A0A9W6C589_9FIRM|nr:cohesin domain-containing protein [Sellimonas catena]GLG04173.1 hypothetical protein Selli1_13470 [Sellimonas catena]
MKLMKRLAAMLLAVCLVVPCASLAVNAADGLIFFTDLEGISVGETFTITGSVVNRDGNLSQVDLTMSYDSTAMRYVGGDDNVTDQGDGTLVYSGSVDGSRLDFDMQFEALIQGETRLEQESAEVTDANGDTLNLLDPPGYSDVQIVEGDGTAASSSTTAQASGVTLTVNDTEYTVASSYPDSELPAGFVSADITVGGETVTGASRENGSAQLVYLLDGNNDGAFFLYNSEDNTASPIQIVTLTSGSTLILLGDRGDVTLPARYQEVELDISDTQTLPAWQDSKNSRYYLMNALNASGDRALYRYDSTDQTYQYYGDDVTTTASGTNSDSGIFGRVSTFVQDHVDVVMIGAGFAFLVLLLLIIILAVKLHRRNLELDDVYDELDELTKKKGSDGPGGPERRSESRESAENLPEIQMPEEQFDEFEQYGDEDFEEYDESEDEEFEDYDDDYEDFEDDYEDEEESDEDSDYDSDYDDFEEDYEDTKPSKKSRRSKKNNEQNNDDDDDFSIDFIDL